MRDNWCDELCACVFFQIFGGMFYQKLDKSNDYRQRYRKINNGQSNLAKGGITDRCCHLGNHKSFFSLVGSNCMFWLRFDLQISAFSKGSGPLSDIMRHWTPQLYCQMAPKSVEHFVQGAGMRQTYRQHYREMCRNRRNRIQRCRLKTGEVLFPWRSVSL